MGLIQIWQRGGMAFSSFDTLFYLLLVGVCAHVYAGICLEVRGQPMGCCQSPSRLGLSLA